MEDPNWESCRLCQGTGFVDVGDGQVEMHFCSRCHGWGSMKAYSEAKEREYTKAQEEVAIKAQDRLFWEGNRKSRRRQGIGAPSAKRLWRH